ncbi:MAG: ribonuclease Z [Tissierellia bacterium]|nr:ribonuclease Z [Tissierellia bacterium]
MLDIVLLGSGGGMPMPNRYLSSLLIKYMGRKLLFDCGEGCQVAMRKVKSGFKTIDIICISHIHGDHIFGLPGLLSTIGNSERTAPITIIGPVGISNVIKGMLVSIAYLPYDIHIIEDPKSPIILNSTNDGLEVVESDDLFGKNIILNTLELDHSAPCLGYNLLIPRQPKFLPEKALEEGIPKELWSLLQKGESIQYNEKYYESDRFLGEERKGIKISFITDTRPLREIIDFIDVSDLFICEGTYGDNDDLDKAILNKHMTFKEAAELAKLGNVKELLLTHFSTAMDNPEEYLDGIEDIFNKSIIGYDGFSKSITYTN